MSESREAPLRPAWDMELVALSSVKYLDPMTQRMEPWRLGRSELKGIQRRDLEVSGSQKACRVLLVLKGDGQTFH